MRPLLVVTIAAFTSLAGLSSAFAMACVGGASCTKWKNNCTLDNPPRCTSVCVQCGYPKATTGTKATSKTLSGNTGTIHHHPSLPMGPGHAGAKDTR